MCGTRVNKDVCRLSTNGSISDTTEVVAGVFPGTSAKARPCRGWLFLLKAKGCYTKADIDVLAPCALFLFG